MLEGLAAAAASALQVAALAMLLDGDGRTGALLSYLGLQALAAAMLVLPLWRLLSHRMRAPWRPTCAYLFAAGLFIPLGGPVVLLGMALAALRPRGRGMRGFGAVALPQFGARPASAVADDAVARRRAGVAHAAASASRRLAAVSALQAMPSRSTSPLLRTLLADGADDIRVLAYGMLDAAEQRLTRQILQAQACLDQMGDGDPSGRAAVHGHLAQLHWELVYQNLAQGDVRGYTLEQADRHAEAALQALSEAPGATTLYVRAADGADVASPVAGLWQLRGRLALARRDPAAARAALQRATALGFPRERALPLMAEAAYLEGDFTAARAAMQSLRQVASLPPLPQLQPLLRYWTS